MSSYYSVIQFVSNQWYRENVTIGLLAISGKNIFFRTAAQKIKLAESLNPEAKNILSFSLKQLNQFISSEQELVAGSDERCIEVEQVLNEAYVERLHRYSNGIVRFSPPEFVGKAFDCNSFATYFQNIVGANKGAPSKSRRKSASSFFSEIEQRLHKPLENKVDVSFTLKKRSLPSLYFDFELENIGVNGSIIASASIDINKERIDVLHKKLTEYETVIDRLRSFAKSEGIGSDHTFYLIANSYDGETLSNQELDSFLQNGIKGKFERISTSQLDEIVKKVNNSGATKFSTVLREKIDSTGLF